jgi:hypothetical protein
MGRNNDYAGIDPCVDGSPLARGIEGVHLVVGAAMCPACSAALSSPLAIMPFAGQIPDQFHALQGAGPLWGSLIRRCRPAVVQ